MLIALNIILATIVIVAIVGMLARSIDRNPRSSTGLVRSARRRRRITARAQYLGKTAQPSA